MYQRAARVIQRNVRGTRGRWKSLVYQKLRDSFVDAYNNQYFYVNKALFLQAFKPLVEAKQNESITDNVVEQQQKLSRLLFSFIKPEPLLKSLHMNLSPPLNQGLTYRMFTDDESNVLLKEKLKSLNFRQTPVDV